MLAVAPGLGPGFTVVVHVVTRQERQASKVTEVAVECQEAVHINQLSLAILRRETKREVPPDTSLVQPELVPRTIPKRVVIQDAARTPVTPVWPARFEKVAPLEATGPQDFYVFAYFHYLNLSVLGEQGQRLSPSERRGCIIWPTRPPMLDFNLG